MKENKQSPRKSFGCFLIGAAFVIYALIQARNMADDHFTDHLDRYGP